MAVKMKTIEFKENQEPSVSAENLNQMQANMQEALGEVEKNTGSGTGGSIVNSTEIEDKTKNTYSAEIIDELISDDGYIMGQEYTSYVVLSTKEYYTTYRGFVPFKNAHKYNITITSFKLYSGNTTTEYINDNDASVMSQKFENGFVVSNKNSNTAGGWCAIRFTLSKL